MHVDWLMKLSQARSSYRTRDDGPGEVTALRSAVGRLNFELADFRLLLTNAKHCP